MEFVKDCLRGWRGRDVFYFAQEGGVEACVCVMMALQAQMRSSRERSVFQYAARVISIRFF